MMRMPLSRTLSAATFVALACSTTYAHSSKGHQIIAEIAYLKLPSKLQEKLIKELGGTDIMAASTWADEIRTIPRGRSLTPEESAFLEDTRNTFHRMWHYADIPFGSKVYKASLWADDVEMDVVQATKVCMDSLLQREGTPRFPRSIALKLLIHLVGDLHQPLHVSNAFFNPESRKIVKFSTANSTDLLGGNLVKTNSGGGGRTANLHAVWDTAFVDRAFRGKPIEEAQAAAQSISTNIAPLRREDISKSVEQWALSANQLAQQAYEMGTLQFSDSKTYTMMLPDTYQDWAVDVTKSQLYQAGIHLATLLKTVLEQEPDLSAFKEVEWKNVIASLDFLSGPAPYSNFGYRNNAEAWAIPPEFNPHIIKALEAFLPDPKPQLQTHGQLWGIDFPCKLELTQALKMAGVSAVLNVHIVWEGHPQNPAKHGWRAKSIIVQSTGGVVDSAIKSEVRQIAELKFGAIKSAIRHR